MTVVGSSCHRRRGAHPAVATEGDSDDGHPPRRRRYPASLATVWQVLTETERSAVDDTFRPTVLWEDVDLDQGVLRISAAVSRVGGTAQLGPTKTASSRRQLRLPAGTGDALRQHRSRQLAQQDLMGEYWAALDLVFPTSRGTLLDPANLRRDLAAVTEKAGLGRRHPHELRHSAASLLSAAGVPLEEVADVLGHASTRVTSATYRHRTTPTVEAGAGPMNQLLGAPSHNSEDQII